MIDRIARIHDRDDPRVGVFRDQKDAWLRAAHNPDAVPDAGGGSVPDGLFMAEGALVVEHLLASDYPVHAVLVSEHRLDALAGLLGRVPPAAPIYAAPRPVLEAVVGFDVHRGLLACARRLPPRDPLAMARGCRALVVLEDLANHDNLGSVFRSAAVLGGAGVGVLLSPRCCDPLYRKALRVSMGHALRIPFATLDGWPVGLESLAGLGFTLLAMDPAADAEAIGTGPAPDRPALLLGAEGPGLSDAARRAARRRLRIPQSEGADSLNIAVAAAVAMHRLFTPV